jgi:hypothetical protein
MMPVPPGLGGEVRSKVRWLGLAETL